MTESDDNLPVLGLVRPDPVRATLRMTSQGKIVGHHPSIREVLSTVEHVAKANCTVLVTGESGTGKELVVAALHDASLRSKGPVVTVNCAAIPQSLIEAHLFGHVKGAFTGAATSNQGMVAAAEGGTLFFDEIGELPPLMQVKLLRLLQQREYIPVGDFKTVRCDIRVVAATNRDLETEVAAGRFREDLFYRLNVVHLHLPTLRQRGGDIELLAMHFLRTVTARSNRVTPSSIEPVAMKALTSYAWPGNIRELENAIERAVLLAPGAMVTLTDLPQRVRDGLRPTPAPPMPVEQSVLPPAPVDTGRGRSSFPEPPSPPEPLPRQRIVDTGDVIPPYPPMPAKVVSPFAPPLLPEEGLDLQATVESFENALIVQALRRTSNNKNRAAQLLQMNRTTLIEKIRRKRLDV